MFLRSLTLRGFKSFADPTTLELEPGVTVVVGPNGSGKSNVVDAVAWVLGAQGPRALRSSRMDDVIFAGTKRRPALGRAEVTLTIDNSAGRLPIELTEVTVTRTLFRTGESEYALNGAPCRLLDIQELFSDTGVGRQQHVIVGQGQLDGILSARAEDRRAVIEEAAGILKYRRRRERAERRLDASEGDLVRLQDLLREVQRQHKPLERQAEAARRSGALASELRAIQVHLAGRELGGLARRVAAGADEAARVDAEEARLREELGRVDAVVAAGEALLSGELDADVGPLLARLETLRERARGLAALLAERRRSVAASIEALVSGDVVASLEAELSAAVEAIAVVESRAASLAPEWDALAEDEKRLGGELQTLDERFAPARAGAGGAGAGDLAATRAELARSREAAGARGEALARARARAGALEARRAELMEARRRCSETIAVVAGAVEASRAALAAAAAAAEAGEKVHAAATEERRRAERALDAASARSEMLRSALDEARARAGVATLAGLRGVVGTLRDAVDVDAGYELAFEAAVEASLDAVVVDDADAARAAVEAFRGTKAGGAVLLAVWGRHGAAGGRGLADPGGSGDAADGGEPLRAHVRSAVASVSVLLDDLLAGVVCCAGGFSRACDIALGSAGLVVVTPEGDRLAPWGWRVGAGRSGVTRAALDDAQAVETSARAAADGALAAFERAGSELGEVRSAAGTESTRLVRLEMELAGLEASRLEAEAALAATSAELVAAAADDEGLAARAASTQVDVAEKEAALAERERADAARHASLAAERDARTVLDGRARALAALRSDLEVRAAAIEERRAMLSERRADLEARLTELRDRLSGAAARRSSLVATSTAVGRLAVLVESALGRLATAGAHLKRERDRQAGIRRDATERLTTARRERGSLERSLAESRERQQRVEIEQTEARVRLQAAEEALRHELDVEPDEALVAACPELPVGVTPAARARDLERELRVLGPVNPLAVEELKALEERSEFLARQLEDVRAARRELGGVIRAVDAEIAAVFEGAFEDVSRHFEALFTTLFPGGSGSLTLIPGETPLDSGVDIEARPAGRGVRRLSLLSGGERSLVALAFLFAVFRSRPSPFYLMDEVEAALDDVNLRRFLALVDEFRDEAQLILVSHQKRTMEAADVLYGVTMQPGGASKVVCEHMTSRLETPR